MTDFARPDGTLDLEALRWHGLIALDRAECVICHQPFAYRAGPGPRNICDGCISAMEDISRRLTCP